MIYCVNYQNIHEFGDLLRSQFQLRHEGFIERQNYNVSVFNGMEYDQYDTPATTYLIYENENREAIGVNRLGPTTQGCMLKDLVSRYGRGSFSLCNNRIWEGTGYCIKKDLPSELRQRIINEMAVAYLEFGLLLGLRYIVGMMPTYIYRSVFERPGIEMEYLGPVKKIDRHNVRAVAIPVKEKQLLNVRNKTGIFETVLQFSRSMGKQERICL